MSDYICAVLKRLNELDTAIPAIPKPVEAYLLAVFQKREVEYAESFGPLRWPEAQHGRDG